MNSEQIIQQFLSLKIEQQKAFLKTRSTEQLKEIFFALNKDIREKAFNLLNPEAQTKFMQCMSLGEQKEFFKTSTQRGQTIAFNSLQVSDRKAYIDQLSKTETKEFTKIIRKQAVELFWTNERELIKQGLGTRDWTPEQMEAILNIGEDQNEKNVGKAAFEVDSDGNMVLNSKGKGVVYEGHHMLNVEEFPEYAGDSRNIQPLTKTEHFDGAHNGNYQNSTSWYYDPETGRNVDIDLSSPETTSSHFSKYPPQIKQTLGYHESKSTGLY